LHIAGGTAAAILNGVAVTLRAEVTMNKVRACCAVLAAVLAGADAEDAGKKELERFSGTWRAVSAVIDGKELSKDEAGKITLTVNGEKYTYKGASGEAVEGTHKLDPARKPRELDAVRSRGKGKGETVRAIYELSGDTYKVCLAAPGKPRPREFASKPGSGHRLLVFKRVKE